MKKTVSIPVYVVSFKEDYENDECCHGAMVRATQKEAVESIEHEIAMSLREILGDGGNKVAIEDAEYLQAVSDSGRAEIVRSYTCGYGNMAAKTAGHTLKYAYNVQMLHTSIDAMVEQPANEEDALLDAFTKEAFKQLEEGNSTTEYGEPQAWLSISSSGRLIEITHETNMLKPEQFFYSGRLHCNNAEFDAECFHNSMGIIQTYCTESGAPFNNETLREIVNVMILANKATPVKARERRMQKMKSINEETHMLSVLFSDNYDIGLYEITGDIEEARRVACEAVSRWHDDEDAYGDGICDYIERAWKESGIKAVSHDATVIGLSDSLYVEC